MNHEIHARELSRQVVLVPDISLDDAHPLNFFIVREARGVVGSDFLAAFDKTPVYMNAEEPCPAGHQPTKASFGSHFLAVAIQIFWHKANFCLKTGVVLR